MKGGDLEGDLEQLLSVLEGNNRTNEDVTERKTEEGFSCSNILYPFFLVLGLKLEKSSR